MTDFILHQFDLSPFAEKIRKAFGVKRAAWSSVQIPMVMPKPDLTALTGGYRKTPVLQIGADIYCDTMLIADVIDRLLPDPPLFRSGRLANIGLQHWSDGFFFPPGAALSLHENAAHIPAAVSADRREYFSFLDFSTFETDAPHFRTQFRAHAALVDAQLSDGRDYLFGDAPEWTDIGAHFNLWMAAGNIPSADDFLSDLMRLPAWRRRMTTWGEGVRSDISPEAALEAARAAMPGATPVPQVGAAAGSAVGAAIGERVAVDACEHGNVPVEGAFLGADDVEIVIRREDPRVGDVAVHFPRLGYRIRRLA